MVSFRILSLIPQTSFLVGTFFATSYSKMALVSLYPLMFANLYDTTYYSSSPLSWILVDTPLRNSYALVTPNITVVSSRFEFQGWASKLKYKFDHCTDQKSFPIFLCFITIIGSTKECKILIFSHFLVPKIYWIFLIFVFLLKILLLE